MHRFWCFMLQTHAWMIYSARSSRVLWPGMKFDRLSRSSTKRNIWRFATWWMYLEACADWTLLLPIHLWPTACRLENYVEGDDSHSLLGAFAPEIGFSGSRRRFKKCTVMVGKIIRVSEWRMTKMRSTMNSKVLESHIYLFKFSRYRDFSKKNGPQSVITRLKIVLLLYDSIPNWFHLCS